jgi:hypothetical protein
MREGNTSRVMGADRPYGEFYDFYSVGPEYFGYSLVERERSKRELKNLKYVTCRRRENSSDKWKEKNTREKE